MRVVAAGGNAANLAANAKVSGLFGLHFIDCSLHAPSPSTCLLLAAKVVGASG